LFVIHHALLLQWQKRPILGASKLFRGRGGRLARGKGRGRGKWDKHGHQRQYLPPLFAEDPADMALPKFLERGSIKVSPFPQFWVRALGPLPFLDSWIAATVLDTWMVPAIRKKKRRGFPKNNNRERE
jgi:hypothetical protein